MRDTTRRRMIQLSGGIALAGMAGCLGSDDEEPTDENTNEDDTNTNESSNETDENEKDDAGANTGDKAPEFNVETPEGETVTLEPVEKPTVVLFTDVTSEEGKTHSQTLVDLHEKHGEEIRLITINSNLDVSKDDLREFRENYGGDWKHAMSTVEVNEKYGIDATATLCVVDDDGELALRFDGEITASAIEDAIEAYTDD